MTDGDPRPGLVPALPRDLRPLVLLHPRGIVRRWATIDDGSSSVALGPALDLAAVEPAPNGRSASGWTTIAEQVSRQIAPDGLVLLGGGRRQHQPLVRALASAGAWRARTLLRLRSGDRDQYLLPNDRRLLRFVITNLMNGRQTVRRAAGLILKVPGTGPLTTMVTTE